MTGYKMETLQRLWEGKLSNEELRSIQGGFKDPDRFQKFLEYLSGKVEWDEKILLPLQPHLFVVQKSSERVIKCECGHEFGDYRQNWKLGAQVFLRETDESLQEIYPPLMHSEPDWIVLREFYCPGCYALLEVEAVPPGCPLIHDFQPDLDSFYRDWLGEEL